MNKQEDRILTYFTQNEDELREKKRLAISEFAKTEKDR